MPVQRVPALMPSLSAEHRLLYLLSIVQEFEVLMAALKRHGSTDLQWAVASVVAGKNKTYRNSSRVPQQGLQQR
jgi:hypothetical protein